MWHALLTHLITKDQTVFRYNPRILSELYQESHPLLTTNWELYFALICFSVDSNEGSQLKIPLKEAL